MQRARAEYHNTREGKIPITKLMPKHNGGNNKNREQLDRLKSRRGRRKNRAYWRAAVKDMNE